MSPKTLLEMAGATAAVPRLKDAVLVVIDAQREYIDGALPLVGVQPALAEIGRLLARARRSNGAVLHVIHRGRPGGLFAPGTAAAEIAIEATPLPEEPVIEKTLPNAFAGTNLREHLAALERKDIVLVGFMTHMCVEATARAAIDLGFKPTVVASAAATRDLPNPLDGSVLPASEVHRNALAALADRFATIAVNSGAIPH